MDDFRDDVFIPMQPAPKVKSEPRDTMAQLATAMVQEVQGDAKVLAGMLQNELTGGYVDVPKAEAESFRRAQQQTQGGMMRWQQQVGTRVWLEQMWDLNHTPKPYRTAYIEAIEAGMSNADAIRYAQVKTATPGEVS